MAERAERARWMKSDPQPDFVIPMMIDYINDPPNTDNAIRSAYRGGGFYSGFLIDCDGTVLLAHSWAWFAPGKDWWNLPLAPIANLHAFLDSYLADPPPCYGDPNSTPPDNGAPKINSDGPANQPAGDTRTPAPAASASSSSNGCAVGGVPSASSVIVLMLLGLGVVLQRRRAALK